MLSLGAQIHFYTWWGFCVLQGVPPRPQHTPTTLIPQGVPAKEGDTIWLRQMKQGFP